MSHRLLHVLPRIAAVAVPLAAAVAGLLAAAAPAGADDLPPTLNSYFGALACAAPQQCALVAVSATSDSTGHAAHVNVTMSAYHGYHQDGSAIARVQIDSVRIESLHHTVIAQAGVSAPGDRGPATTTLNGAVPDDGICRVYGVEVHESVRLADGALQHGGYVGGWFIPRQASCPERGFAGSFQALNARGDDDSLNNVAGVGIGDDHRHLIAFARVADYPGPDGHGDVARIQIDNVQLLRDGAPVTDAAAPFGPENSGTVTPWGTQLFVVSRSFTVVPNCGNYSSRVTYSIRFTDGTLRTNTFVSARQQFCAAND